ncbi:unnamed protein product [Didymodactylos carnosus]|uniref:PACRG-like protein n=1 Tax=Didymodactylos carnosus TaxID=1234261 RepID=A0A813YHM8_9BILA|nr:unnamed protein product [Didymodactylos carnosus]CAF1229988.1 unnamed protein product [Didymodactylos carnosus]CAF3669923.1 unnamed protein product [Didymodactylos carnosus]CAF4038038.1 unnamed protein product [Didymodactylos carnosus]
MSSARAPPTAIRRVASASRAQITQSSPSNSTRLSKPSDKLCPKTIDVFSTNTTKQRSPFADAFASGRIPCRLIHGSVKNRLAWNTQIEDLNYDPVLILLAEGLREIDFPLTFISRQGFQELLATINAKQKVLPLLTRLINPIKLALNSSEDELFEAALNALTQLSTIVGSELDKHLKTYLSILAKRMSKGKHRDFVANALNIFEENGGKDVLPIIKAKIPTYCSVHIG